jgi:transcriptional regulator with XRE-family HTH domain
MNDIIDISTAIKALRGHLDWTQPELAKALGVSTRTVARYESGVPPATVTVLGRLSNLAAEYGREDLSSIFGELFTSEPAWGKGREEDTIWLNGFKDVLTHYASRTPDILGDLQDKIVYALRRIRDSEREKAFQIRPEDSVAGTLADCEAAIQKRDFERRIETQLYRLFNQDVAGARPFEKAWASLTNQFGENYMGSYSAMESLLDQALKESDERDASRIDDAIAIIDGAERLLFDWAELRTEIRAYFDYDKKENR